MKKKYGFTLVELLIVMVIMAMLCVILLRSYTWISNVSFRIMQEKNVNQEVFSLSQILQNFADRNTIDYTRYSQQSIDLNSSKWITDKLYLIGQDWNLAFYTSWDCSDISTENVSIFSWNQCWFYVDQNEKTILLTNPNKIYFNKALFKIIPFASQDQYTDWSAKCDDFYINCINKPWFRLILKWYSANYWKSRTNNVQIPIQQFF